MLMSFCDELVLLGNMELEFQFDEEFCIVHFKWFLLFLK